MQLQEYTDDKQIPRAQLITRLHQAVVADDIKTISECMHDIFRDGTCIPSKIDQCEFARQAFIVQTAFTKLKGLLPVASETMIQAHSVWNQYIQFGLIVSGFMTVKF